jgi:hypothetical protein
MLTRQSRRAQRHLRTKLSRLSEKAFNNSE